MAKCAECGAKFDVDGARQEYQAEFNGELDYDEDTGGTLCGSCAGAQASSNINVGAALQMMNGDEDYDAEHVERYL